MLPQKSGAYCMEDLLNELMEKVIGRIDGPMSFRLYLQPLMAIFLAVRDGRADAKSGRTPFLKSIFTEPENRRNRLQEGWKTISRVFWLAVVLDLGFQFLAMPTFRPGGALLVALILAVLPYAILRGLVNRFLTAVNRRDKN